MASKFFRRTTLRGREPQILRLYSIESGVESVHGKRDMPGGRRSKPA